MSSTRLITCAAIAFSATTIAGSQVAAQQHAHGTVHAEIPASIREEHAAIHQELEQATAAPGRVGAAARAARNPRATRLAEQLALHAKTEEEVYYPAAVLVGDVVRATGAAGGAH